MTHSAPTQLAVAQVKWCNITLQLKAQVLTAKKNKQKPTMNIKGLMDIK